MQLIVGRKKLLERRLNHKNRVKLTDETAEVKSRRKEVEMSKRVNLTLQDSQYEFWLQKAQEKNMTIHDFIKHAVKVYLTLVEKYKKERK